jgi:hypothetical protein
MTKPQLRKMIINLLDDENGVNSLGHDGLVQICVENGWEDINNATELQSDRAFLNEDDAIELLKVKVE